MSERWVVREAVRQDIDRVVELWAEHVDFHASLDPRFERREESGKEFGSHLGSRLGQEDFLLLVAEVEGEVVGFINGELTNRPPCFVHRAHGFINDLAVSPRWQRRGAGGVLVKEAMAWFHERGAPTVEARVLKTNSLAMGFWRKAGFEPYMQIVRVVVDSHEQSRESGESP
jgi:ribosomal protein S18 acetylase RimI-like enzyme